MRIHHFTIPAYDPERVARVLAELLGARVIPLAHPQGTQLVYADDADGSAIEVWPAATRGDVGTARAHAERAAAARALAAPRLPDERRLRLRSDPRHLRA